MDLKYMETRKLPVISLSKSTIPSCSLGCFARDQHNRVFAVTTEHLFCSEKHPHYSLRCFCRKGLVHTPNWIVQDSCHLWNITYGIYEIVKFGPSEKVMIDFALVLLCDKTTMQEFSLKQEKEITVYSPEEQDDVDTGRQRSNGTEEDTEEDTDNDDSDNEDSDNEDLEGKTVQKYGCTTGLTNGMIVRDNYQNKNFPGTFIVVYATKSPKEDYKINSKKMFSDKGDSGALVKLITKHGTKGLGIVHRSGPVTVRNIKYDHATVCVKLEYCKRAMKNRFHLDLKFFDMYDNNCKKGNLCKNKSRRRSKSQ